MTPCCTAVCLLALSILCLSQYTAVRVCSMTEDSASALADLLKKGDIEELNIYSNDVGDGGIFKVHLNLSLLCWLQFA